MAEQSPHFRFVFTNVFGMSFGDNDVVLRFAMDLDPRNPGTSVMEEVGVVMTPRSAKILAHSLNIAIETVEKISGPISIPPGKLEAVSEGMELTKHANPPLAVEHHDQSQAAAPPNPKKPKARKQAAKPRAN